MIMDGAQLMAGSVACVSRVLHPVSLARLVMTRSKHVLLVGAGAEAFAAQHGMELIDPQTLVSDEARREFAIYRAE